MAVALRRGAPSNHQTVQRWDPLQELEQLSAQLGQLVEGGIARPGDALFTPPADIEETEDAWIVEAELPGVDRKDINVEAQGSELVVSGEIKERERKGILRRRTRPVGFFELRVALPGDIDADNVEASVNDGVLTVKIPKTDRSRARRIDVASG
jgi:HSP20 family protein